MNVSEQAIAQWYLTGLTEKEWKGLIGHVKGALAYGQCKAYAELPSEAKDIIRVVYRYHNRR